MQRSKLENRLQRAARDGRFQTVQRLIEEEGADPSLCNSKGLTLLMWAAVRDAAEWVGYLVQQNLDVNAVDREGRTALMWAAEYGHLEVVEKLIDCGADPTIKNKHGHNAAWYAAWEGFEDIQSVLERAEDLQESASNLSFEN